MAQVRMLFINATEGFHQEGADTDELLIGSVVAAGVGGIAFDANNNRITEVATPTSDADAATKGYVDGVVNGLDWKESVRVATAAALPANTAAGSGVGKTLTGDANGALTVDGVSVALNDRVLVKDEVTGADNGIYTVTQVGDGSNPFILTRATDADEDDEVTANLSVFAEEGTSNADSGWTLVSNDPITVDTTSQTYTQFTGVGSIVAGAGLIKSGSNLDVELDTDADAQGAGADGGSSGLEFDVSGDAGQLRVKVDPAAGIQRLAAGIGLEIDDTPNTLDVDADGLKVVGLPSLFQINDVAVGANVTAANLDTLVGGTESSADALHRHDRVDGLFTADEAISVGDGVCWSPGTTADRVVQADAGVDAESRVFGVARTAAAGVGNTLEVCAYGRCAGAISGATVGNPYYIQNGGGIGTALPGSNNRIVQVGFAINATDLWVKINDFGKKI